MSENNIIIEQYSEKAIVVKNSQSYKEKLKEMGGKWNPNLKNGAGWIFHNSKRPLLEELQRQISSGSVKEVLMEKKESVISNSGSVVNGSKYEQPQFISMKIYLELLSRIERLEAIVSQVDFVKGSNKGKEEVKIEIVEDDSEEEDEEPRVERLLRKPKK